MPDYSQYPFSEFLAIISHEFRTPLAGLKASIELLQGEARYLTPQDMERLLGSLHLSVSSLQTLVDNLLESARIDSGHFTVSRRVMALNEALAGAIRIMQPLIRRRGQSFTVAEPFAIPPVYADPVRLVQVIVNLLSNACTYSPLGTIIDLGIEFNGETIRVSVADRGDGVPEAMRDQLFRPFVRHDSGSSDSAGVGLGLSVVKAIIDGHGGQVGVEPRELGGSVFWFTLPTTTGVA
jgi:two-component system, OmpR family, sensor histidine kinase KdpD